MSALIVPEGTPVDPADVRQDDFIVDPLLGEVWATGSAMLYGPEHLSDGKGERCWTLHRGDVRAAIRPAPKPVEPGPEVVALLDVDGDVWRRLGAGWALRRRREPASLSEIVGHLGPVTFLVAQEPRP